MNIELVGNYYGSKVAFILDDEACMYFKGGPCGVHVSSVQCNLDI